MSISVIKDLNLFGEEKTPTIDDVIKRLDGLEKSITEKDTKITELEKQLEEEKIKNAQYKITGITKKVETHTEEQTEPLEFDFTM